MKAKNHLAFIPIEETKEKGVGRSGRYVVTGVAINSSPHWPDVSIAGTNTVGNFSAVIYVPVDKIPKLIEELKATMVDGD